MKEQNIVKDKKTQMKEPKEWQEIDSPNFFKFEHINDMIEGILTNVDTSQRYGFGLYTLKTYTGENKRFHGSAQLDDLLMNIELPSYVKIMFIDTQETANGNMKLFKVFKGKN